MPFAVPSSSPLTIRIRDVLPGPSAWSCGWFQKKEDQGHRGASSLQETIHHDRFRNSDDRQFLSKGSHRHEASDMSLTDIRFVV